MSLKKPVIFSAVKEYYWCTVKRLGKSFNRQPPKLYTKTESDSRLKTMGFEFTVE
jgi:hypothetical protein